MKPVTPVGSPSPLRLLNKGPEYLRRQMESGNRGRAPSAVERLEADKPKYVKSQKVMNTKQETIASPSVTPQPSAQNWVRPGEARRPCQDFDARKENSNLEQLNNIRNVFVDKPSHNPVVTRRATSKRVMRPDSLIIYRQKRDCKTGSNDNSRGYNFIRRLFQGSTRDKQVNSLKLPKIILKESSRSFSEDSSPVMSHVSCLNDCEATEVENHCVKLFTNKEIAGSISPNLCLTRTLNLPSNLSEANSQVALRNRTLQHPNRDHLLRNSVTLSEEERFFNYCGLDPDMAEHLGLSNVSPAPSDSIYPGVQNVSMTESDDSEFSHGSRDGEGLYEEEIQEQVSLGISIIERNARIIKWLYSCKKAKEGPRESTV
ncbi:protein FAM110D [Stegostoma tigrinum]|uniref:protein FAM110D n=1 Tax=Stegostoma tigrinum TaxID=3053191 RepID=UPI00202B76E3|nr:protein FAM110D [Stegostoma tigrinum]XP_048413747.1 protein FAM110D [Stegostoma tigrinum]XP_048413749.1 protein FAM110D [Stegostoma tigrinum]XP_048413750.1 protein FAM110D [Stegostoma tigrinum]XP_048413751.1 protein FAM110D [Stegostoma tigrinum]XP_048413752.1 protein FAM110D [Stegostoma tigrinum]XP_048413753.1 protein FAM110D [Stegostoma tigrinum]XP_059510421.1 protein FAM110D [Stegostoma tigrinum]